MEKKELGRKHYESKFKIRLLFLNKQRLKFLKAYEDKYKNKKQHVGGCKGRSKDSTPKSVRRGYHRMSRSTALH